MRGPEALPVLSEAIRQVRIDARMAQKQFAKELGCTRKFVQKLETGLAAPLWLLLPIGEMARPGPAKRAIVEELRKQIGNSPLVKVVA